MNDSWEENQKKLQASSEKLLQRWESTLPKTVIMCGSGWTEATKKLEVIDHLSYDSIDCLTPTTVEGHKSNLLLVKTKEAYALIFQGRKHFYEGGGWEPVINPILLSKKLGCDNCVLTNAAGGINMSLCVGDIMLMNDHINLMPTNPLIGRTLCPETPRFPDQTNVYSKELGDDIQQAMKKNGFCMKSGIYLGVTGPAFETPAEIRAFQKMGADAVGMSTIPEAMVANAMGMKTIGISCISNMAAGISNNPLTHEEVAENTSKSIPHMQRLFSCILECIQ